MTAPDSPCQGLREEAAVALLTRAPLPAHVAQHAQQCPPCRQEWAELAVLPGLLATVGAHPAPAVEPSGLLLPRLLREVAAARRRRRRWLAAAVAVLVIGVGAGVGAGWAQRDGDPPVAAVGEGRDSVTGARAEVTVRRASYGSLVELEVYDVPPGSACRMEVVDRVARRIVGGSWVIPPQGYEHGQEFDETVSTTADQIAAVEVVDERTGQVIVSVRMRPFG